MRLSRRDWLTTGAAALLPLPARATTVSNYPRNRWGTPGLYPARVAAVKHSGSTVDFRFQQKPIQEMIRAGMTSLTGARDHVSAWQKFVRRGDVVGIKLNPNANDGTMSSPEVILEIVSGLMAAGVRREDIVVYERYRQILDWIAPKLPAWLQKASASPAYGEEQTAIAGYDPAHYVELPFVCKGRDASDPAQRRSYAAEFITRRVNKLINLAVLKDHNAAGVTLALKNLSHGLVNNVNRSHPGDAHRFTTFIPAVVAMPVIRYKAVLHIVDGIHGLYESGPHGKEQYNWAHQTMYFATDAVAIDRVGWRAIDAKRVEMGLPVTAESGPFGQPGPIRQPGYIEAAGQAGLGEWRDGRIDLRTVILG